MSKAYNFYDLISNKIIDESTTKSVEINSIEIPKIQRDYAQGRINNNIITEKKIEKLQGYSFLSAIFKHLQEDSVMLMDYVYGSLDKGIFVPLDGQQRLTTLFLLYWVVGSIELSDEDFDGLKTCLNKFTYETRNSSRIFCNKICKNHIKFENHPSSYVKNQDWYNISFEKDPTIQAMFNMMDAIFDKYMEGKCSNLFNKLNNLQFYILYLNNYDLSDELYVKMNSRGKQLTHYENFKADFTKWLKDKNNPFFNQLNKKVQYGNYNVYHYHSLSLKFDNEWTSFMWHLVKNTTKKIDKPFMQFIYRFTLNKYVINDLRDNQKKIKDSKYATFMTKEDIYNNFANFKYVYELSQSGNSNTVFDFENFLDRYINNFEDIEKSIQPSWSNSEEKYSIFMELNKLNERFRVIFFAVQKYLENFDYDNIKFKQWMRVVWNIAQNTDINVAAVMIGVIQLINEIGDHADDIYNFFADSNNIIKSDSSKNAVAEERRKAKFIISDPTWEDIFIKAEKHPYIQGCINFLIDDDITQKDFIHRTEMAYRIFDEKGFSQSYQQKNHLLLRALISNYNSSESFKNKLFFTDIDEKEHYLKKMLVNDEVIINTLKRYCDFETEELLQNQLEKDVQNNSSITNKDPDKYTMPDFQLEQLKYAHELIYKDEQLLNWMQCHKAIRLQFYDSYQAYAVARPQSWYDWIILDKYRIEIGKYLLSAGYKAEAPIENTDYIAGQAIRLTKEESNSFNSVSINADCSVKLEIFNGNNTVPTSNYELNYLNYEKENKNFLEELKKLPL